MAGEGTFAFECDEGGVGNWGILVGVGYESTDDLHENFSGGIEEVVVGEIGAGQDQRMGWWWERCQCLVSDP